jgi:hypothetical protein
MKKLFTSLAAMIIVAIVIIMLMGCNKNAEKQSDRPQVETIAVITDVVTTETSAATSTTSTTTTATTSSATSTSTTTTATTSSTSTTTSTTTTTVATTEYTEETESNMTINYSINELTYYSGPSGCCGRWGRTLLNDYSIASNLLADGTIVHIESDDGSINGDYRVDDTGGMGNNVIDIFYTNYSNVPYPFSRDGRISCTVWVYE